MSRANEEVHKIIDETRRSAIDAILALGSMSGDKNIMNLQNWFARH